jgi:hypothetical protein
MREILFFFLTGFYSLARVPDRRFLQGSHRQLNWWKGPAVQSRFHSVSISWRIDQFAGVLDPTRSECTVIPSPAAPEQNRQEAWTSG